MDTKGAGQWAVLFIGALFGAATWTATLVAAEQPQTGFVAATEENDSLANPVGRPQDRHYTQGLKIVTVGGDDFLTNATTRLNRILPAWAIQPEACDLGLVLVGQNIYTPTDLRRQIPDPRDRPYAGWLYTGFFLQRRQTISPNLAQMENFEVNLGVVGPDSIAEEAQKAVHRWWFPEKIPQGWGHQIKNEPGLILKYARLWRYAPFTKFADYLDVVPRAGAEVGNVATLATVGTVVRIGYLVPPDFGVQTIDSPASNNGGLRHDTPLFSTYGFVGVDGRLIAHDITLDGNSFRDSPSVRKEYFVSDLSWGFALEIARHLEISYTHIARSKEFHDQQGRDNFASITIKGKLWF